MRASRAFTLIELLMTIGVIGILAALVLSAINRTRATTQAITCRNNLRQWGVATHSFAADHEDLLPKNGSSGGDSTRDGWYVDLPMEMNLPPYAEMPWRTNCHIQPENSVWICPSNPRRCNASPKTNNLFHYCLNENVNGVGHSNQVAIASIRQSTTMVWLFDNGGLAPVAQQNNVHSNLHSRGAQFLFVDGHVARFRNKEYWNFTAKKGLTNNPELVWFH